MSYFLFEGVNYRIFISKNGYPCISLKDRTFTLHRLVWEVHYGPIPEGYQIHHIDFDKKNYDITNLQLVDRKTHNLIHRQRRKSLLQEAA